MADITTEEDSLISQDDIDKLLNASSFDEAASDSETADDDGGEFSQDDIDNLLNGLSAEPDVTVSDTPSQDDDDGDFELVSQADIDSLLSGADLTDDDLDDGGEFSQDDIDSLLNSVSSEPAPPVSPSPEPEVSNDTPAGDDDLVSQEDIDKLLNGAGMVSDEPDDDDGAEFSQDDIDSLLDGLNVDSEPVADPEPAGSDENLTDDDDDLEPISLGDISKVIESSGDAPQQDPEPAGEPEPEAVGLTAGADTDGAPEPITEPEPSEIDDLIDESQGLDIQDCLVTQDTIDRLIQEDEAEDAEVDLSPGPDSLYDAGAEELPVDSDAAPVDLATEMEDDDWESEGKDISQEDIDKLLGASDDDTDEDDDYDSLISQDDIEELLQSSDEDDVDFLASGDEDLFGAGGDDHQVVLEEADAISLDAPDEEIPEKKPRKKRWYTSKLVLAGLTLMILLGAGIPSGYFLFFKEEPPPEPEIAATENPVPGMGVNNVEITLPEVPVDTFPGTMSMEKFMVLVSGRKDGLNYVSADISIDYSNGRAKAAITDNPPQYRDIIFNAIASSLSSEDGEKVTEADLRGIIKDALNKALPGTYIEKVTFTAFQTG